jgi:hypothetical protein
VDQYVDNRQKEILWDILANPADNGALYAQSLERLVQDNPQSGLLQILFARTGDKQLLNKASVYYDPRTLYKLINNPGDLPIVDKAAINYSSEGVIEHSTYSNTNTTIDTVIVAEETAEVQAIDTAKEAVIAIEGDNTEEAIAEPIAEIAEEPATENEIDNNYAPFVIEQEDVKTEAVVDGPVAQQEPQIGQEPLSTAEPQATEEPLQNATGETYNRGSRFPKREVPNNITPPQPEYPQQQDIDDDVYDEIVSIEDIGFEAIANEEPAATFSEARFSDPTVETSPEEEEASAVLFHQPDGVAEPVTDHTKTIEQEDRLILGGIVNTDYLSFDKKLDELRNTAPAETTKAAAPQPQTAPPAETQEVSRYDDDKMPYTFMWWLNKTRKEHAENLQPYATGNVTVKQGTQTGKRQKAGSADELQHQYYENIFSLTSVSGVDRETDPAAVAFDHNKKEDVIIERFIHTEPQIKPLSADKLDNENKAKKSSEDLNDFVTETLARIYTDQMLYHKAIATYKKLILKYPEKKLYFAAQIEQLEKKTN